MKSKRQYQSSSSVSFTSLHQRVRHQRVKYSALLPPPQNMMELIPLHYTAGFCHSHFLMTTSALHSCQEFCHRAWEERSSFCGCPIGMSTAELVLCYTELQLNLSLWTPSSPLWAVLSVPKILKFVQPLPL